MSSSMPIPKRKQPSTFSYCSSSSSSSPSLGSSSPAPIPSGSKGKGKAVDISPSPVERISHRRPSLLGSSFSKSEYTVVNLGHSDGPPRLVTCVKSSQGFDWNQELFLPSYIDTDSHNLEHRPDPVEDIILTDEEAAAILPQ